MTSQISYRSFCWCVGTTSFRMANLNRRIEQQLRLLDEFRRFDKNVGEVWKGNSALQTRYYDFMKEHGFLGGTAKKPAKDARQKTSGLINLGLINDDRHLTPAGRRLLEISLSEDFSTDNILHIPRDSYLYLRQLLKTSLNVDGNSVRPLPILIHFLLESTLHSYLTFDEFRYLLPLCIDTATTERTLRNIVAVRAGEKTIDSCILDVILSMDNYRIARRLFLDAKKVTPELMLTVGMNRKSRTEKQNYDLPYYYLYNALERMYIGREETAGNDILNALDGLRQDKLKSHWVKALFGKTGRRDIADNALLASAPGNPFTVCDDIHLFRAAFFDMMHLIKSKVTLDDYCDQNMRYFSIADILIFKEGRIYFDVIPAQFFALCGHELYQLTFTECAFLYEDSTLAEISPSLAVDSDSILRGLRIKFDKNFANIGEALSEVERERLLRFNELIDSQFDDESLITLLELFKNRDDGQIQRLVTDNATVPTIFEYILGIIWYKLSGRSGNILDYMKLSLDANLLPKSHAAGGGADIVYEYEENVSYPAHKMLLEATLSEKTAQRKMEMEPVSRHLGDELINSANENSYCVFVTDSLDPNVVSDFRGRRNHIYYDRAGSGKKVCGMKIIPLDIADIKTAVLQSMDYPTLYRRFDTAYKSNEYGSDPMAWYGNLVAIN